MNKLNELLVTLAGTTPGIWEEDNDGFIASAGTIVADARCDIEPFADANTAFLILAKNAMPDILYALQTLQKMVEEDQKGEDAFYDHGPAARAALRKLQVRV